MNQAGVLACPAQPGCHGKRSLHHGPRVHIRARLEGAELLMQPRLHCSQPLEQHLVIIARPPLALGVRTTAPCISRNPAAPRLWRFGREWCFRVDVARKAHQRRTRPRKRRGHAFPRQLSVLGPALQVAHGSCAAFAHPRGEAPGVALLVGVGKRHQPGLGEPRRQRQGTRLSPD